MCARKDNAILSIISPFLQTAKGTGLASQSTTSSCLLVEV